MHLKKMKKMTSMMLTETQMRLTFCEMIVKDRLVHSIATANSTLIEAVVGFHVMTCYQGEASAEVHRHANVTRFATAIAGTEF